jgi:hypothetical protein
MLPLMLIGNARAIVEERRFSAALVSTLNVGFTPLRGRDLRNKKGGHKPPELSLLVFV